MAAIDLGEEQVFGQFIHRSPSGPHVLMHLGKKNGNMEVNHFLFYQMHVAFGRKPQTSKKAASDFLNKIDF